MDKKNKLSMILILIVISICSCFVFAEPATQEELQNEIIENIRDAQNEIDEDIKLLGNIIKEITDNKDLYINLLRPTINTLSEWVLEQDEKLIDYDE